MPRSSLTLAAAAAAAVPDAVVVRTRLLGDDGAHRYDAALVELTDGRTLAVRAATDAEADRELRDELRVLESLSAGVRSLLPFRAPQVHGRATLSDATAAVTDFLDGYAVSAAELPPGGAAAAIGRALAAVHDLPVTVVRDEGLPVRSADQTRVELSRLVDRTAATGRLDTALRDRWRLAIDDDTLWRFESTVVLGGTDADRFRLDDDEDGPVVTGVLGWGALSVGDPAVDLTWLSTAPDAAASVLDAYLAAVHRAPDALLAERARLYAELDFASWLLHGLDIDDETVVADAVAMLGTLAASTSGVDLVPRAGGDVIDAVGILDRVPRATGSSADTSMQTDAYDPAALAAYLPEEDAEGSGPVPTLPVDLSEWTAPASHADDAAYADEASRASESALRRWRDEDASGLSRG